MLTTNSSNRWERIYYNFLSKCLEIHRIDQTSDHCYMVVGRWQKERVMFIDADFKVIE